LLETPVFPHQIAYEEFAGMKNVALDLPARSVTEPYEKVLPRILVLRSLAVALALIAVLFLAAGCSDDEPTITYPVPPEAASKLWMYDVFGNSADDIYVSGHKGTMAHFDGTSWSEVDMNTSHNIVSIWGEGDGILYACGEGGSIWKNSGSGWGSMDSGTSHDLVGIGSHYGDIHISGTEGSLRRLSGSEWVGVGSSMIVRDANGGPVDTLRISKDIASLVTVNHYFVGGAYRLSTWDQDDSIGVEDTDGMILGPDVDYPDTPELGRFDWHLRPVRSDEIAASEWIQCSTSDDSTLSNNYLGTSEGWIMQLSLSPENRLVWSKMYPRITADPRAAINDMWLDRLGNVYMVTHSGQIVFQSFDYNLKDGTGYRVIHQASDSSLQGLWGLNSEELFAVGLTEKVVLRYRYDSLAQVFESVATDTLQFDEKSMARKALTNDSDRDKFGRPLTN
jgi:hypothetical protein